MISFICSNINQISSDSHMNEKKVDEDDVNNLIGSCMSHNFIKGWCYRCVAVFEFVCNTIQNFQFNIFLIQQLYIKLIKLPVKTFIMLETIYISNKWCSFELSIYQIIKVSTNILSCKTVSTLIIINSWAPNQHVRMLFLLYFWF